MKKIYWAATAWMIFGLFVGVFYREFTRAFDFTGYSQLRVLHTHSLALGMMMNLIILALAAVFHLHHHKQFTLFFVLYNLGVAWTVAMMFWHGIVQVAGGTWSEAQSGLAGIGHIIITVALALFFTILAKQLKRWSAQQERLNQNA